MYSLRPGSVPGQVLLVVCLLSVLLVLDPGSVRGSGEPDWVAPFPAGKSTLASVKIDTTSQFVTELAEIPILVQNDVELGSFELEVDFCHEHLHFLSAERGAALSDTTDGKYDWELFTYRLLPYGDTLHRVILLGAYDAPNEHQGIPLLPNPDYVELIVLKFVIQTGNFPDGTFLPIIFEWEMGDCLENTFQNLFYDSLYVSRDSAQFDPVDCPAESLEFLAVLPSLEFSDGGAYAYYASGETGDINLNGITYEVADWVLFVTFLLYGDTILVDPAQQAANSDVNCDYLPWSIADLLYLNRVILTDAPALVCDYREPDFRDDTSNPEYNDRFVFVSSSAHPGDSVSVPVWLSNSTMARGVTFRVGFDSSALAVEALDTSQARISGWDELHAVINPGETFFFGYPNWWEETNLSYSSIGPGEGVLLRLSFVVSENAPGGIAIPVTFETVGLLGHYNSYTDTSGLVLVQPATVSGWIFTDVISGDANSDGMVSVADAVYLLNFVFKGKWPPSPLSQGDFNQDGLVDIADVIALLNYLFGS